jgi:hypothetical protein
MDSTRYTRAQLDTEAKSAFREVKQHQKPGAFVTYYGWDLVIREHATLEIKYGVNGVLYFHRIAI